MTSQKTWERDRYGKFLYRLHVEERKSVAQMAKLIGVWPETIKKWLKKYGITIWKVNPNPKDTPLPKEFFSNDEGTGWIDKGKTPAQTASETNIPINVLKYWAKQWEFDWGMRRMHILLANAIRDYERLDEVVHRSRP